MGKSATVNWVLPGLSLAQCCHVTSIHGLTEERNTSSHYWWQVRVWLSQIAKLVDISIRRCDELTPHLSRFVDNQIRRCRRIDTTFVPISRHFKSSMSTNRHKYFDEILLQINARFVDILLQEKNRFVDISEKWKNTATTYFSALFRELSQFCIVT